MKLVLIVNPAAGRGRGRAVAQRAAEVARAHGMTVAIRETNHAGHALERARDATDAHRIGIIGGDGTLREVITGLADRCVGIPLGLLPLGNANVIARELGIPLDPQVAIDALIHDREARIDVGVANGHDFLAMVGVGFDTFPTRFVARARRTRLGGWIYALPGGGDLMHGLGGFAGMLRFLPTRFLVEVDGKTLPIAAGSVVVSNARTYAKDFSFAPDAAIDDHRLDVTSIAPAALPFAGLVMLKAMRRERQPEWLAQTSRGRAITISAKRAFHWHADGDPMEPVAELAITLRPWQARILF
jgi:diacylglycerol kinase (ATP)